MKNGLNMPTPEEIKKIAAEIAEVLYNEDKFYNHHLWWSEEPKECKAKEVEDVFNVILRDYCIVPKSKVRENYQSLKNNIPDFKENPEHHCGFLGGMTELELLFGKSLFEE